jgi:hypothetical protein
MYFEKIREGAKSISCWLHREELQFNQEAQHIRCHYFFAATNCSQIRERNLLYKRARWFCGDYCWLIMIEHHVTHWLIDYWMTVSQLPVSFTCATKFRPIITFYLVRLQRHALMFQFYAFFPRFASYFSVALTTGYCGKILLERSQSSCKISALTYRQFSGHEVANQKSFINFCVYAVTRLVQRRTVKLFHTGMTDREVLHCDVRSSYWRHEMSENGLHYEDLFLVTRIGTFWSPLSLLSNRVYFLWIRAS